MSIKKGNQIIAFGDTAGSIKNQNPDTSTTKALYHWKGTLQEWKDQNIADEHPDWLCYITDDVDNTYILQLLYPVNSLYIGCTDVCPLASIFGEWEKVAQDRVLQGAGTRGAVGTTINESLPNIKGDYTPKGYNSSIISSETIASGAFKTTSAGTVKIVDGTSSNYSAATVDFNASRSSSTYQDNAPVQPDAFLVNIWKRIR